MPRSALLEVHDLSPRWWLSIALKATTDCPGDVYPVKTCHASSMESSTSNRTPPPRPCIYLGITRTWNFYKFCRTFIPVPGTSVSSVRLATNARGTGTAFSCLPGTSVTSVRPCQNDRNLWKFCEPFTPVPRTFVKSEPLRYPHRSLLGAL